MTCSRHLSSGLAFALVLSVSPTATARAQDAAPRGVLEAALRNAPPLEPRELIRRAYLIQHALIWEEVRNQQRERLEARRERTRARRGRKGPERHEPPGEGPRRAPAAETRAARPPVRPAAIESIPLNVRANDPAQDLSPGSGGQAEVSMAAIGSNVMVSWNDGDGFERGTAVQGVGTSQDGGATYVDRGNPPLDAAYKLFRWRGDPVVGSDPARGYFYLAGLGDLDGNSASTSLPDSTAIFIARGTVGRLGLLWHPASIVRALPSATWFLDKEWVAADSLSGNVYVVYTLYNTALQSDWVMFARSVDFGGTWSGTTQLSSAADAGDVQGAQIAIGPAGEIHTCWFHNDPVTGLNQIRFRRSLNGGVSFEPEQTVTTLCPNFGTGAPGFDRPRGMEMPSLTVDRTAGQYRGRAYIAFSQAYDFLDDAWPAQPPASTVRFEIEPNGSFAHPTQFLAGETLRGSHNFPDTDCWVTYLDAGQNLIVWLDSTAVQNNQTLIVRAFGSDSTESLAYGAAYLSSTGVLTDMMYTITAPVAGWYFLRVTGSGPNYLAYRLRTKLGVRGGEPGRDRRDVFACWSQAGTGGWASPVRICDSPVGVDDFLPGTGVGPDGYPYAIWFDGRDDLGGAVQNVYASRSDDGGASWRANAPLSSAGGSFNDCQTDITPDMGDYVGLCASATRVHAGWGDARGASVDTWTTSFAVGEAITNCPAEGAVPVLGSQVFTATMTNPHPFYTEQYLYAWSDDHHWIADDQGYFSTPPGGSQLLSVTVTVPAGTAEGTVDHVCLTIGNSVGAIVVSCCFDVTARGTLLAVGGGAPSFALSRVSPNPAPGRASIGWSLAAPGRASLAVYDVAGARVRTLARGEQPAGPHQTAWDGRDDAGTAVRAGIYYVRLESVSGRLQRSVVLVR